MQAKAQKMGNGLDRQPGPPLEPRSGGIEELVPLVESRTTDSLHGDTIRNFNNSTLLLNDESGVLVSSTCTDYAKFRRYVARTSRHATAAKLKRLEPSMGINHHAAGVLLDAELGPLFFGSMMFDWMHPVRDGD